jgi:glutamate 5-kinase
MATKLIAAEIATAAGVTTIITSSRNPQNIFGIIEYYKLQKPSASETDVPSPTPGQEDETVASTLVRPPHTMFIPSAAPLGDLQSWINHALRPSGSVIIDIAAHGALSNPRSSGRLFPLGVLGVRGVFAAGQAVRIIVRRKPSEDSEGVVASAGHEQQQSESSFLFPGTPSYSRSLTPLSDYTPDSPAERADIGPDDEDFMEVGRGLANYNSLQIARVKGLHRYVLVNRYCSGRVH